MNEKQKSHAGHQKQVRTQNEKIDLFQEKGRAPGRKPANIPAIIVLMTVVWTMYGLELYQKHHPFKGYGWYLVVLSSVLALGGAGFLLYCRKKRKVYIVHKGGRMRGEWICRDEDALIYWMYMALYLFWEGVAIYVLITLSHQMINGLPLKV